ncbi:MAG: SDR family oxidoreductase [Alphaproteobacteria bacterium]|nr:SDR family oxidoreductase [Alphaproteobacteria bacterium]
MRLHGKKALVIGGSSGIGAAIARRFAREGAQVGVVASRDIGKAEAVAAAIAADGGRALAFAADVADRTSVGDLVAAAISGLGAIDILVNSAGVYFQTPIGATPEADVDRMVDINLKGPFHAVNAAAPHMIARGSGKIINLASASGFRGAPSYTLYAATKAAIVMMTRSLACDLAPHGINVNAIAPGNTATPMNENIRTSPEFAENLALRRALTPSGRTYSDAADMAAAALFLASEESRAMHGATLLLDEGATAGAYFSKERWLSP